MNPPNHIIRQGNRRMADLPHVSVPRLHDGRSRLRTHRLGLKVLANPGSSLKARGVDTSGSCPASLISGRF